MEPDVGSFSFFLAIFAPNEDDACFSLFSFLRLVLSRAVFNVGAPPASVMRASPWTAALASATFLTLAAPWALAFSSSCSFVAAGGRSMAARMVIKHAGPWLCPSLRRRRGRASRANRSASARVAYSLTPLPPPPLLRCARLIFGLGISVGRLAARSVCTSVCYNADCGRCVLMCVTPLKGAVLG